MHPSPPDDHAQDRGLDDVAESERPWSTTVRATPAALFSRGAAVGRGIRRRPWRGRSRAGPTPGRRDPRGAGVAVRPSQCPAGTWPGLSLRAQSMGEAQPCPAPHPTPRLGRPSTWSPMVPRRHSGRHSAPGNRPGGMARPNLHRRRPGPHALPAPAAPQCPSRVAAGLGDRGALLRRRVRPQELRERGKSQAHQQFNIPIPRDGSVADLLTEAQRPDRRFAAVICESIERVARRTYFGTKIEYELEQAGVALCAADEPIITGPRAKRATPTLTRRVKQAVSEWYVLQMLELSWDGFIEHVSQGWNVGKPRTATSQRKSLIPSLHAEPRAVPSTALSPTRSEHRR